MDTSMTTFLFILATASIVLSWFGHKKWAISLVILTIALCALWFNHHITDSLNIDL